MSRRAGAIAMCLALVAGVQCSRVTPDVAPPSAARPPAVKTILVASLAFDGHRGDLETIRTKYGELLPRYIRAVSNERWRLDVTITPWIAMPRPISEYRLGSSRIREMARTWHVQHQLVTDAASLLDTAYELGRFDGLMLAVGANPKDLGRCGYMFRSATRFHQPRTPRGQVTPPTDVHTWNCPFPSIAYALPKMVAGYRDGRSVVPTLYDFDAQSTPGPFGYANQWVGGSSAMQYYSAFVGPWDIQSQHGIWTDAGVIPQGMTSFTRLRLGWIDARSIMDVAAGDDRHVLLSPLVHGTGRTLVLRLPIDADRYYLIENRQRDGVDRHLPAEGVLVTKVDETIPEGRGPVRVVDAHPDVKHFAAAPFTPGETFRDREHGITVVVLGREGNDYRLRVTRERPR